VRLWSCLNQILVLGFSWFWRLVGLVDALSDPVGSFFGLYEGLNNGCVWADHSSVSVFQITVSEFQESRLKASAYE
jgi:hypothetical protein